MKTLVEQLSQYAAYHRDRRNIATHFVGIPMIFVAIASLVARPYFIVGGVAVSPLFLVGLLTTIFYFALDLRYGLAMMVLTGLSGWAAIGIATRSTSFWLATSLGLFLVGWVIQFIGHAFEGKKPAFLDDLVGLLVGPLFIVAEAGFAFGLRSDLRRDIESRVGPTHIRTTQSKIA
jgi:uncharacterized membrane protein YGL010W